MDDTAVQVTPLVERGRIGRVFIVAVVLTTVISLCGFLIPQQLGAMTAAALHITIRNFSWLYLLATATFLVFCIYLFFSPYGHLQLGRDGEAPAYSFRSWLAMLFSAGMGIGLIFWGVAEPMYNFVEPPMQLAAPYSAEAARIALRYAFFHWCLHPWAIYAVVALSVAYFQYRHDAPGLVSAPAATATKR